MDDFIQLIRDTLAPAQPIEPSTPILSSGLADSFSLVQLIDAVEERYEVSLDEGELGLENFDTPSQMLAFVHQSKRKS